MDYKIPHRKLKTGDQHLKQGVNQKLTCYESDLKSRMRNKETN